MLPIGFGRKAFAFLILALIPTFAATKTKAQELAVSDATETTEIIITRTRLKSALPLSEQSRLSDSEAKTGADVATLLGRSAGIFVLDSGVSGSRGEVFVRGADANFTLFRLEGITVNDLSDSRGGAFDLSTLAGDEITHIGLGHGPLSALYGSGALSGVIDLRLDFPKIGQTAYRLNSASAEQYGLSLGHGFGRKDQAEAAFMARKSEDGDRSLGQWRDLKSFSAKASLSPSQKTQIGLFARLAKAKKQGFDPASGGPLYAVNREKQLTEDEDMMLGLNGRQKISDTQSILLSANFFRRNQSQNTPAIYSIATVAELPASRHESHFDRTSLQGIWQFATKNQSNNLGLELIREQGELEGVLDFGFFSLPTDYSKKRDTLALFGETALEFSHNFYGRLGGRAESHDGKSSPITSRLSLGWHDDAKKKQLELSFGRGSKLPSFYALSHPLVGSKELKDEKSEGTELTAAFVFDTLSANLKLTAHQTTYKDLIDFDFATFRLVNRQLVKISGLDLGFDGKLSNKITYGLTTAFLDYETGNASFVLLNRPKTYATFYLNWTPSPSLNLRLDSRAIGDTQSSSIPTGEKKLNARQRHDASVLWDLDDRLSLGFRIENLSDERDQTLIGFPNQGRELSISLMGRF